MKRKRLIVEPPTNGSVKSVVFFVLFIYWEYVFLAVVVAFIVVCILISIILKENLHPPLVDSV